MSGVPGFPRTTISRVGAAGSGRGDGPTGGAIVIGLAFVMLLSGIALSGPVRTSGLGPTPMPGERAQATTISLSPASGKVGTVVTVTGSGFAAAGHITMTFGGGGVTTTPSTCTASGVQKGGGGGGAFSCSFKAPLGVPGNNTVVASDGTNTASAMFNETGLLAPWPRSVDVGQGFTISGNGFLASAPLTALTVAGRTLNCTAAAVGSCTAGNVTTDSTGAFNASFVAPPEAASGNEGLTANDSSGTSEIGNLTIDLDPTVTAPTGTPSTVDEGQPATFFANVTGGSGGDSYLWSGLTGCTSSADPVTCDLQFAGDLNVEVTVIDSNGFVVTSDPSYYRVYPDPEIQYLRANRSSVDLGQPVDLQANAILGTSLYDGYGWSGLPPGCAGVTSVVNCTPTAPGDYVVSVNVTDSNLATSTANPKLDLAVDGDPTAPTPSANRTTVDVGQKVTFSAPSTSGLSPVTENWTGLPEGCLGSGPTVSCAPTAAGPNAVRVNVRDANGFTNYSAPLDFLVDPDPTVAISTPRPAFDTGQPFTLAATGGAGSGGVRYSWTDLPASDCTGATSPSVECPTGLPGYYNVTATVTDSNGRSNTSAPLELIIAAAISLGTPENAPITPDAGTSVAFTASADGGTGTLAYRWTFGDGATGSGASTTHVYAASGVYTVEVWANDTVGGSASRTLTVVVGAAPASSPGLPLLPLALIGLGALVIAGAAAAMVLRRPRKLGGKEEDVAIERPSGAPTDAGTEPPPPE